MSAALTLYYDGKCPFCVAGMTRLHGWDKAGRLAFVDIAIPGFDPAHLGADLAALNRELYGLRADGRVLVGVDSILAAYTLAGQAWRVWPLRIKPLRPVLASAYRLFARHRYRVSRLLGIKKTPACIDGVCQNRNLF